MQAQLLEMGQLSLPMLEYMEFVFWLPLSSSCGHAGFDLLRHRVLARPA